MLDWMSRSALEYIGQGGLGYSFDSLDEGKKNEYRESFKDFMYAHPSSFTSEHQLTAHSRYATFTASL